MHLDQKFLQKKLDKALKLIKINKLTEAKTNLKYLIQNDQTKIIGLLYSGIIEIKKKNFNLAKEYFNEILSINLNDEGANLNLGLIYFQENNYDKSGKYLTKVLSINPKNINSNYHLGLINYKLKNYQSAINFFNNCIALDKNFAYPHINLGHIFLETKNFIQAITHYSQAIKLNNFDYRSEFNLGRCFLSLLDFENGFKFYESRKKFEFEDEFEKIKSKHTCKLWNGENLDNKTILILSEQGIGDIIQFFRYLFWLKDKYQVKIIFYVEKKLAHLFKNSTINIISDLKFIEKIDYYQHLLSLPGIAFSKDQILKNNENYIKVDAENNDKWKIYLKKFKKPIIALNWQGSKNYIHDSMRSIPLKYFEEIIKDEKYDFISLQKNIGSEEIYFNHFEKYIHDLSTLIDNDGDTFKDTISILNNIDLLITSDTAIAHLAGTMNIKTFLLLNYNPEWRWHIEIKKKCFYPNLKIIQEDKPNQWFELIKKTKIEINKEFFN